MIEKKGYFHSKFLNKLYGLTIKIKCSEKKYSDNNYFKPNKLCSIENHHNLIIPMSLSLLYYA